MGGRSSSKTSSTTNTDNRQLAVQDGVGLFSEGDAQVNIQDFGIADRALKSVDSTVENALDTVDSGTARAFDFGSRLQNEISGTTRQAYDLVRNSYDGLKDLAASSVRGESGEVADTTKTLLVTGGLLAGVVLVAYFVTRGN